MHRLVPLVLTLPSLACSGGISSSFGANQDLTILGDGPPQSGGPCAFTPSTDAFLSAGVLELDWQRAIGPVTGQALHYLVGLTVQNTQGDSAQITEVDATFSTLGSGPVVPDVAVPATGLIPAHGLGVTIVDIMTVESSQALNKASHPFRLLANFTVKGVTPSGSKLGSNSFQFPIQVSLDPIPVEPGTGNPCGTSVNASQSPTTALEFAGGPCGEPQDGAFAVCVSVSDGGS
jgi:hypothetical protein